MNKKTKLVFFGSSEFAIPALKQLLKEGYDVIATYTQPPRSAHRGKKISLTPVHEFAIDFGLSVKTPSKLIEPEVIEEFTSLQPDFAVVVAYGLIIPESMLNVPKYEFLNVHPSLLPRWRGAAPIQRTIMSGDRVTGVCVIKVVNQLDSGPIYLKQEYKIPLGTTQNELSQHLALVGGKLLVEVLNRFDQIEPAQQTNEDVTYASKIQKDETRINWHCSALEISNKIHGLSPFPGSWTLFNNCRVKILKCQIDDKCGKPGRILDEQLTIGCSSGAIIPTILQMEGKRALGLTEFLNGFKFQIGNYFD